MQAEFWKSIRILGVPEALVFHKGLLVQVVFAGGHL